MTLLQLINTIKTIALAQPNIHSCVDEFLALNDITAKYSAIVLQQRNHQRNNDFISFNFYLGAADRLTENKDNEVEVQSTAINTINNIVYKLEDLGFDCSMGSYNTFTERFLAEAAGCYTELSINIPVGECEDDFSKEELNATITSNGVYTWIPKGLGFENVKINVDVAHLQDKSLDITKNGNYKVQYDKGFSGLGTVDLDVNVPTTEIHNQTKDELITANNKKYTYTPDKDYTGIGELSVMVQIPEQPIYEEGYNKGKEDGINEQKSKLTDINITENGTYTREDGYGSITVDVPISEINNQEKSITITQNGQTDIVPDTNYTGLSKVGVNVNINTQSYYDNGYSQGKIDGKVEGIAEQKAKLTDISITENGTYEKEDGYKSVVVNVPVPEINNQEKSITINSNGTSSITPDTGYTGISKINITTNVPTSGGDSIRYSPWSGSVDEAGLKELYWHFEEIGNTSEITYNPIKRFQANVWWHNWQNNDFKVSDYDKSIDILTTEYDGDYRLTYPKWTSLFSTDPIIRFKDCENLIAIPEYGCSSVKDFSRMCFNCPSLRYVPKLDTSSGQNFYRMFYKCSSLTDIPNFNISKGTDFRFMFEGCSSLNTIPLFDTSAIENFSYMFARCDGLTIIPHLDTSNGTNFSGMFYGAINLSSIPRLNTSKGTDFSCMFYDCSKLKSIPDFDYRQGTNFSYIFCNCSSLTTHPGIYSQNGTNFLGAYEGCSSLTSITLIYAPNGTDFRRMFQRCTSLKDVYFRGSINASIEFDACVEITDRSIKSILTACSETTNTDAKTVSFPERTIAPTDELAFLITKCTSKGWTVTGLKIFP